MTRTTTVALCLCLHACAGSARLHTLAMAHNERGVILLGEGKLDQARASFRLALEYNPHFSEPWNNLGIAAMREGDHKAAMEFFSRALKHNPDFAEAASNLGVILLRAGEPQQARKLFEDALDVDPAYVPARINLVLALLACGEGVEAREQLERILLIEPGHAGALVALGTLHLDEGDLVKAGQAATQAIESAPDDPAPWLLMARIHLAREWAEPAVEALAEADLRAPGPTLWLEMGLAHLAAGQPGRARVYLSKLVDLEPGSCTALEALALALEALGDDEGAIQARSRCSDPVTDGVLD